MTKKTKILSGLVLSSLLASAAYANHGENKGWHKGACNNKVMEKKHKRMGHKMPMLKVLKQLNLTTDQKEKIKVIIKETRQNKKGINEAFTKNSFNKEKFIKLLGEKRENMLKSKADMIEKVYNILSSKQKEQFKTLIDLQKEKMGNRFHHKG